MKKLYGVVPAMTTPFDKADHVDIACMRQQVDFLISKGVHGLYPMGTTGEMLHLTTEERKTVAKTVVEQADGRVPVYLNCGANTTREVIELAQHAAAVGADGIGCVTPYYLKVNDREMVEFYTAVANSVPKDFPVYLYGIPQCACNDISLDACKTILQRCPNVVGMKYSFMDFNRLIDYCNLDPAFEVMVGLDLVFLQTLTVGSVGIVSGISSTYPEPFVAVYNAYVKGDLKEAERLQKIAVRYVRVLRACSNMAYFKAAQEYRGLPGSHMRAPQLDLSDKERADFLEELKAIDIYGSV